MDPCRALSHEFPRRERAALREDLSVPLLAESYDWILCLEVAEHIPQAGHGCASSWKDVVVEKEKASGDPSESLI